MIKLVVSDLDGTLIAPGFGEMPKEIFTLIPEMKARGIDFCMASGRQYPCLYNMFRPVSDEMYFIANNGGDIHYRKEILRTEMLDTARLSELIDDVLSVPEFELEAAGLVSGYTQTKNETFLDVMRNKVGYKETVIPDMHTPPEPFVKIALNQFGHLHLDLEIAERYRAKYGDTYDVVSSGNGWLDFMSKGVGKGNAVRFLREKLGLSKDEVMVFGDNENDMSMFSECGRSFCMSHALPYVRSAATDVTDSVVKELEKLLREDSE